MVRSDVVLGAALVVEQQCRTVARLVLSAAAIHAAVVVTCVVFGASTDVAVLVTLGCVSRAVTDRTSVVGHSSHLLSGPS